MSARRPKGNPPSPLLESPRDWLTVAVPAFATLRAGGRTAHAAMTVFAKKLARTCSGRSSWRRGVGPCSLACSAARAGELLLGLLSCGTADIVVFVSGARH